MPFSVVLPQPNFVAGGTINRGRFITPAAGTEQSVTQAAAATNLLIGVTSRWQEPAGYNTGLTDGFGTVIARSGDPVPYVGPGMVAELMLGGNVTDLTVGLTSDADGKGVAASSTNFIGAWALRLGSTGEYIPVFVAPWGVKA